MAGCCWNVPSPSVPKLGAAGLPWNTPPAPAPSPGAEGDTIALVRIYVTKLVSCILNSSFTKVVPIKYAKVISYRSIYFAMFNVAKKMQTYKKYVGKFEDG